MIYMGKLEKFVKNFLLGTSLMCLLGCSKMDEGTIVNKEIEPENTFFYLMPIPHTMSTGKIITTFFTYVPILMYDDKDYVITIESANKKGDIVHKKFYVPQYDHQSNIKICQ